jgi:hypothetical protein
MAIDIYASLHAYTDVKLSKQGTALLLAKHADANGVVKMSYKYIALLIKGCKRTAIRHMHSLIASEILFKKPLQWIGPKRRDWNVYQFCIKFKRMSAHPFTGDTKAKRSSKPENPEEERKEALRRVREDIQNLERGLRLYPPPDPEGRRACEEKLRRLRTLLAAGMEARA